MKYFQFNKKIIYICKAPVRIWAIWQIRRENGGPTP